MDRGTKWRFPESYFPRYTFLRSHILDFLPRFNKIVDYGRLGDIIANGKRHLRDIEEYSKYFKDHVTLSVFGKSHAIEKTDLIVQLVKDDVAHEMRESTTWMGFIKETRNRPFYESHIAVYVIKFEQELHDCIKLTDSLSAIQKKNIIFYNFQNKQSYFCSNTIPMKPAHSASASPKGVVSFPATTDGSPETLSKVIQYVLEEKLVAFMESIVNFTHRFVPKPGHQLHRTIIQTIDETLQSSLRNGHIISEFLSSSADDQGQVLQVEQAKLTNFIQSLFKVTINEFLSKQFGLPTSIVHWVLNNSFNIERKVEESLETFKPELENVEDDLTVKYCKHVGGQCGKHLHTIAVESESHMDKNAIVFDLMMQLEFELHGLMKLSKIPRKDWITAIPVIPKLSVELQTELLKIDGVESCGHQFGKLTLHVKTTSSGVDEGKVLKTLKKHYYNFSFEIVKDMNASKQSTIVHGDELRSSTLEETFISGSLGCFVKLKGPNEQVGSIYGVTCAHCVVDENSVVLHKMGGTDTYEPLGNVALRLLRSQFLDVALVRVNANKVRFCDMTIRKPCGIRSARTWIVVENGLIEPGTPVYMYGAESELSKGFVGSSDQMSRDIEGYNSRIHGSDKLDPVYTLLIYTRPNLPVKPFSREGDSGSVVCVEDIENCQNVRVVALLCGDLKTSAKYICSHGSNLKRLFDIIQDEGNYTVVPGNGN